MGYTSTGDPFVRSSLSEKKPWLKGDATQVGPIDKLFHEGAAEYKGQYIAAGYTGHGMPRAFGW
jgi:hypothetical protein